MRPDAALVQRGEAPPLETTDDLDRFLASVERRAYLMARLATGSRDDALDVVQEAMFQLVQRYADRSEEEWGALFYRILQNRLRDWHRRTALRRRWRAWFGRQDSAGEEPTEADPFADLPDPAAGAQPAAQAANRGALRTLQEALERLPRRQREAFLLRAWEGLDVEQTARAMGCSTGSVKTHYARALASLRAALENHWP